jgi:hypothetical protein
MNTLYQRLNYLNGLVLVDVTKKTTDTNKYALTEKSQLCLLSHLCFLLVCHLFFAILQTTFDAISFLLVNKLVKKQFEPRKRYKLHIH